MVPLDAADLAAVFYVPRLNTPLKTCPRNIG
jgi:hypothetical protein